jgi:hypothetical protein
MVQEVVMGIHYSQDDYIISMITSNHTYLLNTPRNALNRQNTKQLSQTKVHISAVIQYK